MADDVLPADEVADCPFCLIVFGRAPAEIVHRWDDALAIVPLNPVTPGHTLIIPNEHVTHALVKPAVASLAMRRATEIAHHPCNLITSVGAAATQTVGHLHLHIVPRRDDDGLALPWSAEVESLRATVARLATAAGDYLSAREARLGVIRDAAGPAAYYAAEGAEKAAEMALRAGLDATTAGPVQDSKSNIAGGTSTPDDANAILHDAEWLSLRCGFCGHWAKGQFTKDQVAEWLRTHHNAMVGPNEGHTTTASTCPHPCGTPLADATTGPAPEPTRTPLGVDEISEAMFTSTIAVDRQLNAADCDDLAKAAVAAGRSGKSITAVLSSIDRGRIVIYCDPDEEHDLDAFAPGTVVQVYARSVDTTEGTG